MCVCLQYNAVFQVSYLVDRNPLSFPMVSKETLREFSRLAQKTVSSNRIFSTSYERKRRCNYNYKVTSSLRKMSYLCKLREWTSSIKYIYIENVQQVNKNDHQIKVKNVLHFMICGPLCRNFISDRHVKLTLKQN